MKENEIQLATEVERMTSLEIAQVTGKPHNDVMKAIRKMEPAWESERQGKFSLTQIREEIPNGGYRLRPVYILTKTECLYVATKFNDVARARLVLHLVHGLWSPVASPEGLPRLCNKECHSSNIRSFFSASLAEIFVFGKSLVILQPIWND